MQSAVNLRSKTQLLRRLASCEPWLSTTYPRCPRSPRWWESSWIGSEWLVLSAWLYMYIQLGI